MRLESWQIDELVRLPVEVQFAVVVGLGFLDPDLFGVPTTVEWLFEGRRKG